MPTRIADYHGYCTVTYPQACYYTTRRARTPLGLSYLCKPRPGLWITARSVATLVERGLHGLAALFQGGQISEYSSSTGDPWSYVTVGGKSKRPPPLAELVPQRDAWRGVLTGTVEAIREATGRL